MAQSIRACMRRRKRFDSSVRRQVRREREHGRAGGHVRSIAPTKQRSGASTSGRCFVCALAQVHSIIAGVEYPAHSERATRRRQCLQTTRASRSFAVWSRARDGARFRVSKGGRRATNTSESTRTASGARGPARTTVSQSCARFRSRRAPTRRASARRRTRASPALDARRSRKRNAEHRPALRR